MGGRVGGGYGGGSYVPREQQLQQQVARLERELAIAQMRLAYQQKLNEAHEIEQECIRRYGAECRQQQ